VPQDPGAVLSPADGRIVEVSRAQDPYLKRDALKVSVFMNVFNVHSNRSPVDGVVKERWYFPGAFVNAALDKASLENERNALWLQTGEGSDVTCVQVAGLIARRILCYVGASAASASASSASARAWTCICRRMRKSGRPSARRYTPRRACSHG
jgi:phosphatidylserine decarboxylase